MGLERSASWHLPAVQTVERDLPLPPTPFALPARQVMIVGGVAMNAMVNARACSQELLRQCAPAMLHPRSCTAAAPASLPQTGYFPDVHSWEKNKTDNPTYNVYDPETR